MDPRLRLSSVELIASAQVSGTAEGCVHARRISRDEALREIATTLTEKVAEERHTLVLSNAAAAYTQAEPFQRPVAELLADAGADLRLADEIWSARHPGGTPAATWHDWGDEV
jgi:hypothetical protein